MQLHCAHKIILSLEKVHYGGYDANKTFKEEWALRNPNKNDELYKWRDKFLSYDHTNIEFREWWIQRALDMLVHDEIDGIFIDALCKVNYARNLVKDHQKAWFETAKDLRRRIPTDKLLIGNVIRARVGRDGNWKYMRYLDGSYLENWRGIGATKYAKTVQLMSRTLKDGRIIMLNAPPFHLDHENLNAIPSLDERYKYLNNPKFIDFPLGFFLLIVEPHAYFSFHVGVHAKPQAKCVWDSTRFDALTRKLGKPLGDYVEEGDDEYTREFEFLKVHVNIKTQQGMLTVKDQNDEL